MPERDFAVARAASKTKPAPEAPQVTEIVQSRFNSVHADVARMDRSAANEITAGELGLRMSAASDVRASLVEAKASALATVEANEVWMSNSAAGTVQAENHRSLRGKIGQGGQLLRIRTGDGSINLRSW